MSGVVQEGPVSRAEGWDKGDAPPSVNTAVAPPEQQNRNMSPREAPSSLDRQGISESRKKPTPPTQRDKSKKKTKKSSATVPRSADTNGTPIKQETVKESPSATNEEDDKASASHERPTPGARNSRNGTGKASSASSASPPALPPISTASKGDRASPTGRTSRRKHEPAARSLPPQMDQGLPPITPPESQQATPRSRFQSQAQSRVNSQQQAQQASREQSAEGPSHRRASRHSAGGSATKPSSKQQPRGSGKARQQVQPQQQQPPQRVRSSKADSRKPAQPPTRLQRTEPPKGTEASHKEQQPQHEHKQRSSHGHGSVGRTVNNDSTAKPPDAHSRSSSPTPASTGKTSPSSASEFRSICETLKELFEEGKSVKEGMQADYIPELAAVNPELFAVAAVSCDGETWVHGDYKVPFTMQSTCKPLLYCLAQSLVGWEEVHEHVGYEPSGQRFNAFVLDEDKNPHNPMINAGAIMSTAIIWSRYRQKVEAYKAIKEFVEDMAGHVSPVTFDNSVYLSELGTASRNFALTHFMSENSRILADADIQQVLELYFSACSLSCDCLALATIAATLANGGVCPITQHEAMTSGMVQNVLSLMYNCGMYDYSGRFAFEVGIPAKSGVSGNLFLSVPGKLGIAIWSPRLDRKGNTVRGLHVSQRLVQEHPNLHVFGGVLRAKQRIKLRLKRAKGRNLPLMLIHCAADGNLDVVKRVLDEGGVDVNACDQNGRTALHEAIVRGHEHVAQFLVSRGSDCLHKDRFGNTPCSDAVHCNLEHVIPAAILEEHVHRPPTTQSRPSTARSDSPFFQRRDRSPDA